MLAEELFVTFSRGEGSQTCFERRRMERQVEKTIAVSPHALRQFNHVVAKLLHPGSDGHDGMLTHAAGLEGVDVGTAVI